MAQLTLRHTSRSQTSPDTTKPFFKQVASMRLMLKVVDSNQTINAQLCEQLTVGRGGGSFRPDIDLTDLEAINHGISRQHAIFSYNDTVLYVTDLKSSNGTRVNGYTINAGTPYRLHNGDELELGRLRLIVRVVRAPG